MPRDIRRDERTAWHDLQSFGARRLQGAAHQPRGDALALKVGRDFGVGEGDDAGRARIVGDRDLAAGVGFEAALRLVVANLAGHAGPKYRPLIYKAPEPIASRTMKILWIGL